MAGPFANSSEPTILQQINTISRSYPDDIWQNNDESNKYYEAQKRADLYTKMKERKPIVFEYRQTPDTWISVPMYINPDRLSISHQKVKGKAYTRGGIFYHHWGDDHPVLTLSGTTGFSGMKGIQVLEDIYHASGTLLKYQKFGNEKYDQRTNQQSPDVDLGYDYDSYIYFNSQQVDLNSPTNVVNAAKGTATSQQLEDLKKKLEEQTERKEQWDIYLDYQEQIAKLSKSTNKTNQIKAEILVTKSKKIRNTYGFPEGKYEDLSKLNLGIDPDAYGTKALASKALSNYIEVNFSQTVANKIEKANSIIERTVKNSTGVVSASKYKQIAISTLSEHLSDFDSEVISAIASQMTLYYGSGIGDIRNLTSDAYANLNDNPIPYKDDLIGQMVTISGERIGALNDLMNEMSALEQREQEYHEELRDNAFDDVMEDVNDEWRPRVIFIYYENKVYMGHFDAFSYSQEAANQLYIRYEMRITITKTVIGTPK